MKTITLAVEFDTTALESLAAAKGYVVTRTDTHETRRLVEYWDKTNKTGWVKKFTMGCMFDSPASAHDILQALPPGGDAGHDYEVIPVSLTPRLE